jgi:hypothetical protein
MDNTQINKLSLQYFFSSNSVEIKTFTLESYILISLNPTLTKGYVCTPYLALSAAGGLHNTEEELFRSDVVILILLYVV